MPPNNPPGINFQTWLQELWYGRPYQALPLVPLAWLFRSIAGLRRALYRHGLLRVHHLPVPVVVIGNLSVGGTGKTPLLIYLAHLLQRQGWRPGIVSRGYGGQAKRWPQRVNPDSDPSLVGDEAVLLATRTQCPLVAGPSRVAAAKLLLTRTDCDIVLSDDGLQHYALGRDLEIAMIDGERRFGNGFCLPAGPLREPVSRLQSVDLIVNNGTGTATGEYEMQVSGQFAVNLHSGEQQALHCFAGSPCHALAGIGNPQRFFDLLQASGIVYTAHEFPDHYAFSSSDLEFADDRPILMTEKDAVKCRRFARGNYWSVPVEAELPVAFQDDFLHLLQEKIRG